MSNASSRRRGFSLIELLVVIAIIAILVSLLMAGVQKARSAAARISCSNNMHQVALAMHLVADATGALPQGASGYSQTTNYWGHGSWQVPILPFIEQENVFALYQGYDQASPLYHDAANLNGASGKQIKQLLCPGDVTPNKTDGWPAGPGGKNCTYHNYVVNYGNTGIDETQTWQKASYNGLTFKGAPFGLGHPQPLEAILDGTSNTLMLSEVIIGQGKDVRGLTWWSTGAGFSTALRPNDTAPDQSHPWCVSTLPYLPCVPESGTYVFAARSRHTGGVNVAFCDGHISFILNGIAPPVWQALSTSRGSEGVTDY